MDAVGRSLLIFGSVLAALGGLILLGSRLPGAVVFQRGNFSFYFPLVTSILASIFLTVLANVLIRLLGK